MTNPTTAKNFDEYIARFPVDVQTILEKIRRTIWEAAPEAKEVISYQMPAFHLKGNLIYFAAWKTHIGFDATWRWLTLETTVRILDGTDAPDLNLRLFQQMQNRPTGNLSWFGRDLDPAAFLQLMAEEKRLIYEFEVIRAYGLV